MSKAYLYHPDISFCWGSISKRTDSQLMAQLFVAYRREYRHSGSIYCLYFVSVDANFGLWRGCCFDVTTYLNPFILLLCIYCNYTWFLYHYYFNFFMINTLRSLYFIYLLNCFAIRTMLVLAGLRCYVWLLNSLLLLIRKRHTCAECTPFRCKYSDFTNIFYHSSYWYFVFFKLSSIWGMLIYILWIVI